MSDIFALLETAALFGRVYAWIVVALSVAVLIFDRRAKRVTRNEDTAPPELRHAA